MTGSLSDIYNEQYVPIFHRACCNIAHSGLENSEWNRIIEKFGHVVGH